MRENLDIGRPDHVQLIFGWRIARRIPSRFGTRTITVRVQLSRHWTTSARIKQDFKEGHALRTETVINDAYDFGVKRGPINLEDLKEVGFRTTRRLLDVQRISHDCPIGAAAFDALHHLSSSSSTNAGCPPCAWVIHGSRRSLQPSCCMFSCPWGSTTAR